MRNRLRRRSPPPTRPPIYSFGSWDAPDAPNGGVIAVCHPDWRGVRRATYSFQVPIVEVADLAKWGSQLATEMRDHSIDTVVVSGFPPGAEVFIEAAARAGLAATVLLHSSPTQHGAEAGEATVVETVLGLADAGLVRRIGFSKEGVAEMFTALGHDAVWVPNRPPEVPEVAPLDLGDGTHIGVFAEPFWRKNVAPQLGAVALLDGAAAHVMSKPDVSYLDAMTIHEHGELPWEEFMALQASVDLNLYVTLSECFPLTPMESYRLGVPCLASRTSSIFRDDETLWDLATVDELDNPRAIAAAARRLLAEADRAVALANAWMDTFDPAAVAAWNEFVTS